MAAELTGLQRERVLFAARIYVETRRLLGEHPCSTFYTAEDGWTTAFHACVCVPGQITISRFEATGGEGRAE